MIKSRTASFGERNWVRHPDLLEPNGGHTYVCVEMKGSITISSCDIDDERLLSLITSNNPSGGAWALNLLITKKTRFNAHDRVISYPAEILCAIKKHWKIADVCFSAQAKTGSCSMPFSPVPGDPSYTGLFARLVYGLPFRGTLAIAHNQNTNTTYAVCFGINPEHASKLLTRLEESRSYAFFPLHVAYLLSDIALDGLEQFSVNTYADFVSVREAMGTNLYSLSSEHIVRTLDLVEMPRRLTALANALASNCSSLKGVCGIVDNMEFYLKDTYKVSQKDTTNIDVFADRLSLMRQTVTSALRRNEYLRESVQAQVQLVYALLAQKDNELSLQYGADMRVIAIVTLIFLPGTFVATLFSASFWDFSPSNQGTMVSKWVWLYWAITAALTMGVIGIWIWWPMLTKSRDRRR